MAETTGGDDSSSGDDGGLESSESLISLRRMINFTNTRGTDGLCNNVVPTAGKVLRQFQCKDWKRIGAVNAASEVKELLSDGSRNCEDPH